MLTTIYIDGFNLYYGALKGTPYKWLDIVKLFSTITNELNPESNLIKIKYFTAPVKGKVAIRGQQSFQSQNSYLRALNVLYPDLVEIIEGQFSLERGLLPVYKKPLDMQDRVFVWKLEEKQTDVNIALNIYDDVMQGGCEQVILVSNDSDLLPALEFSRQYNPDVKIGVIFPKGYDPEHKKRPITGRLQKIADYARSHINENELAKCQLPDVVPTRKKGIFRPDYW